MTPALASSVVVLLAVILTALGQIPDASRPTQGYQLGDQVDVDIIMPLSIAQCEPTLIYSNISRSFPATLNLHTPDDGADVLNLILSPGVGYSDWICNIPAGYNLIANGYGRSQYYVVQPGSSSACLGDVTTTYEYASYYTTDFQSYTQHPPSGDSFYSTLYQEPTIAFPESSFPTITVNPNLAVTSTTSPTSSPPVSPSASPRKSHKGVIAGAVVGGVAFLLLIFTGILVCVRRCRELQSDAALESPTPFSGLLTSQLGPVTSFLPNSADEGNCSHEEPLVPLRRRSQSLASSIDQTTIPATQYVHFTTPLGNMTPSTPTTSPGFQKSEHNVLSYYLPEPSPGSSRSPGTEFSSGFDVARLTTSQRRTLIAALSASAGWAAPPKPSSPSPPSPLSPSRPEAQRSTSEAHGDLPEITANILGVISRAGLSPREKDALVASLLMPGRAEPTAIKRGVTISSPPPYAR